MDIICKCGHNATDHHDYYHCSLVDSKCNCVLTEADVLHVHITEQQARIDTNRAQVESLVGQVKSLIEEREDLKQELEERRENFTVMLGRLLETEKERDTLLNLVDTLNGTLEELYNG